MTDRSKENLLHGFKTSGQALGGLMLERIFSRLFSFFLSFVSNFSDAVRLQLRARLYKLSNNSICLKRSLQNNPSKKLKSAINFVIIVQFILGSPLAFAGSGAPSSVALGTASETDVQAIAHAALDSSDPVMDEFTRSIPDSAIKPLFSAQDPALDQDPFFLREQNWQSLEKTSPDLQVRKTASGLEIGIPDLNRALHLHLPLTFVRATDDFVFFSLDQTSNLFEKASNAESAGEGLFFLSREEITNQALHGQPVPLFFIPLPGNGWKGKVLTHEFVEDEIMAIESRDGTTISLEFGDIEQLMKAQQINLLLATSFAFKNHFSDSSGIIYPVRGSTAAFGTFFTGIDLEKPSASLWAHSTGEGTMSETSMRSKIAALFSNAFGKYSALNPFRTEPARASVLSPAVIARLVFVGSVLTGMLALSFVLKVAHPGIRMKLANINAKKPAAKGALGQAGKFTSDVFSIFAHVTMTAAQLPAVNFANAVEIFLDKFAPSVAAADNTLIRRLLKNSYYFTRDSQRGAPVDSRCVVLGFLVMGTIDTAFVAVQYLVAIPWIMAGLTPLFNPGWQEKIHSAMDSGNANTRNVITQDVVRQGLGYALSGPSSYSLESRQQVIEAIESEVADYMRAHGKDPMSPANQSEKQKLVEEKVDEALRQRGLPAQESFLFDANTLFASIPRALGYGTPTELQGQESFILARRFGLTTNALYRALQHAREQARIEPSPEMQDVVSILEETWNSMAFVKNGLRGGAEGLKAAKQMRQQLTLLSYEGPINWTIKYLPETWKQKYAAESAQTAGLFFRQSLYSFLSKEGESLLINTTKNSEHFGADAELQVISQIKAEHSDLAAMNDHDATSAIKTRFEFELGIRTQLEVAKLAREEAIKTQAATFEAPKGDWLERRQGARAARKANEKLAILIAKRGESQPLSPDDRDLRWKGFYRDEYARQVGLHIPGAESMEGSAGSLMDKASGLATSSRSAPAMLRSVEDQAAEITKNLIKNDLGMQSYLARLSLPEKLQVEAALYSNCYLQAYKVATIDSQMVSPTAPEAPGRLQHFRQRPLVKRNPFLTRFARFAESFVDDTAIRPGFQARLQRNIPLYSAIWSTHRRLLKTYLPSMTVSYLWSYYAWQVHMPYGTWGLIALTSAIGISTPSIWLNNAFRMNGIKASGGVLSKIAYAVPFSWVTFFGMIPVMVLSNDANHLYTDYIRDPIASALAMVPLEQWLELGAFAGLVGLAAQPRVRDKVSSIVTGTWNGTSRGSQNAINLLRGKAASVLNCRAVFE